MSIISRIADTVHLLIRRPRRSQFAALCYRDVEDQLEPEILLLTSRGTGRWVIPKGWPMGSKPGSEVAKIEAQEEAGMIGDVEEDALGTYIYEKDMPDGYALPCQVHVYALKVTSTTTLFKEKGQRKIEWVSPAEAAGRVQEQQLRRLIRKFACRFDAAAA